MVVGGPQFFQVSPVCLFCCWPVSAEGTKSPAFRDTYGSLDGGAMPVPHGPEFQPLIALGKVLNFLSDSVSSFSEEHSIVYLKGLEDITRAKHFNQGTGTGRSN